MRAKILWGIFLCLTIGLCGQIWAGWSDPVLLEELNNPVSGSFAWRPCLSRDGLTIYFLRVEPTYLWKLWQAQRNSTSDPFGNVSELSELYQGKHLHNAWVSADGLRLYYSRHENSYTKTVIRQAERPSVTSPWTDVMAFLDIHGDLSYDYLASLTGDELCIFYTRRTGNEYYRIYMATRMSINEQFSNRVEVSELNYSGHTISPCVMPDGLTIYFADIRDGRDTYDIYVARRASTSDLFGNIELVGVSTEQFSESGVHVMPDEKTIYYYSSRGTEGDGIWISRWLEPVELQICGPTNVAENSMFSYAATVHYDDGSVKDVTSEAVWSVEPGVVATINEGLLKTDNVDNPQEITIKAQYSEVLSTVEGEKNVLIYAVCPSGSALEFDGVDDYVSLPNVVNPGSDSFSAFVWVRLDNKEGTDSQLILHGGVTGRGWLYRIPSSDKLGSYLGAESTISETAVFANTGEWHHVGLTYNGTTLKLYIDGQENASNDVVGESSASDMLLGCHIVPSATHEYWNGLIDEVTMYDRVLSEGEIQALMHVKAMGDEPGLMGYWSLDEGQGQIVGDAGPFGNDGRMGSSTEEDVSDPQWVISDAPVGICNNVAVDIKPGSCPNPLNLKSNGLLPVAVLGGEEFNVYDIDTTSIRLMGVAAVRSSFEDVASPSSDLANRCECAIINPDGFMDLTLKFRTQDIATELLRSSGELVNGGEYLLVLSGELFDGTVIKGEDCVKLVGNIPKWIGASLSDINGDGIVNLLDFNMMIKYWLEGW